VDSPLDETSIRDKTPVCLCRQDHAVKSSALNLTHVCSVSGEGAVLEAGVTRGAHSSPATCPLENECSWHQAPTGTRSHTGYSIGLSPLASPSEHLFKDLKVFSLNV
jgi:hypothetical protein